MKKTEIIPTEIILPQNLNIIPLSGHPIFPGVFTPLIINNPNDLRVIEEIYSEDKECFIGVLMVKNDAEDPCSDDLYRVGTAAKIIKKINLPDGGCNIFVSTIKRFRVKEWVNSSSPVSASVEYVEDIENCPKKEIKALSRTALNEMKYIAHDNPLFTEDMRLNMANITEPGKIADFVASVLSIEKEDQQKILETFDLKARLERVLVFIKKEQELLSLQRKIENDLNDKIEKSQRESFLREELKAIKDELGEAASGKNSEYYKFIKQIESLDVPEEVLSAVEEEFDKFKVMDPSSSEYIMARTYLETIFSLPWKSEPEEFFNISKSKEILEKEHYGLEDVKKRILEYLAVRMIKGDNKGAVILLVGPPGVGKTSVGKSIAHALNKPFFRFSVGGLRDEAEITGHRRTYIGAMPGKIIQGLKIVKTNSPVFIIDEVDKMGSSHQGDPASALLEVLDPEQNINFRDKYLDLPFDISNVLFILTANTLDGVPEPFLDRSEIIHLSGYIDQEKIEIAENDLIPKNLEKNGLGKKQVKYDRGAIQYIVSHYAREAGVRNLEKCFDKIHRKYCTEILVRSELEGNKQILKEPIKITQKEILKYLSKPVFDDDEFVVANKIGTSMGLAWTSMGGDTLLIESISSPGKGGLQLTGQLGDVMKESANIAMSWTKKYCIKNKIRDAKWFENNTIHLHFPEGATPKDGPSAGITIVTSLLSLLKGKTIKKNLAMTGELSLTGKVYAIGGLREKTVAAKRNKIKDIIIPKANERDLDEIPDIVKHGLTFHPVSNIDDVLKLVF